jgi:hypothetical protein
MSTTGIRDVIRTGISSSVGGRQANGVIYDTYLVA